MAALTPSPDTESETPPAGALSRCEQERAVMRDRLADPTLIDRALEIRLGNDDSCETCLAVPLDGKRVAGEVTVQGWTQALLVLLALDGQPGFPDLRDGTSYGEAIDAPRTIRWGLGATLGDQKLRARMWGYHDAGVRAYQAEQNRADPRIPVTPMPEDSDDSPAVAGIYDMLIGGSDSYLADRKFVWSLAEADAEALSVAAVINRLHRPSVISHLTARGIGQFLDLGCGLMPFPSPPPDDAEPYTTLHDIVARHQSTARIVYADHNALAFGASRITVEEHPLQPQWVQGDIRHMHQFLTSGRVQYVLDWSRPIGVLLHDVLPWIGSDETVTEAMDVLREQLPPGSALSVTHATDFGGNPMSRFTAPFRAAGIDFKPRDADFIESLFGSWALETPGLVAPHRWRTTHPQAEFDPHEAGALAGLAFKPEQRP
ncbi:DUF6302 family protein [Streptomyces sp. NPDC057623]|uniref:DUF6302 family protein n=1 Tax=Streptomyces sp. NPDC057623 TaxID=3346187 RepID=UPI0036885BC1